MEIDPEKVSVYIEDPYSDVHKVKHEISNNEITIPFDFKGSEYYIFLAEKKLFSIMPPKVTFAD